MALAHSPRIVTDGLVLCLDAANIKSYPGSGTVWTDLSGSNTSAALNNGISFVSESSGYFSQDNIDDYIDTNYTASPNNFTVSIWARRTTNNNYWAVLWANEIWNNSTGYVALLKNSNSLIFGQAGTSPPTISITSSNIWSNYAFSLSDLGEYKTYYNGVLVNSRLGSTSTIIPNTIKIGTRHTNNNSGLIDTGFGHFSIFKFYNKVLTVEEIKQNFQALRGRFGI